MPRRPSPGFLSPAAVCLAAACLASGRSAVAQTPAAPAAPADTARPVLRIFEAPRVPREVVNEALRIANAAATGRRTGAAEVPADSEVTGDLAIVEGSVRVAGHVTGRIIALNADVVLVPGARVGGGITVFGGRLTGEDAATVGGSVMTFVDRVALEQETPDVATQENEDQRWWRLRQRWRSPSWMDLRLVSARTYNRVEGLPVFIGPRFGRELGWGRLTMDAMGVARSVGSFDNTSTNLGHLAKAELRFGRDHGLRVGGRLHDIVEGVEPWQLTDAEVGLASFFLHTDYRDYFDRHGGTLFGGFYLGHAADVSLSYTDERWATRPTRNPLTLFRNNSSWRPNPDLDEGRFHVLTLALRYDTRNDSNDPSSGWFLTGNYEFGRGRISRYAATSPGVREPTSGGLTEYDRVFLDLRRYNRVSPDGELNFRVALGGWVSGDELPLQRRFSVGGPGTLPGYDFREPEGRADVFTCSFADDGTVAPLASVQGTPAQCSRVALAQVEYRGVIPVDPIALLMGDGDNRRFGWGRRAQWVVFLDAGRGWLVGPPGDGVRYRRGTLPPLGSFRTDIGFGLRLDPLGLYLAKGVSQAETPLRFFVRLSPRF